MPLTLTGNGTITGLAEGGIEDAKIINADIKDDTISEAKLDIHAAPSGTDKFLGYTSNGMEWTTAGGGKILQVVQGATTTEASSTSQSMADTGLSASITPASNSDVLVTVNQVMRQYRDRNSTNNQGIGVNVLRDSSVVMESKENDNKNYNDFHTAGDGANNETWRHTISFVDTNPGGDGSTALTYKTQFSVFFTDDSGQAWAQPSWEGQNQAPTSYITLMEISGGVT